MRAIDDEPQYRTRMILLETENTIYTNMYKNMSGTIVDRWRLPALHSVSFSGVDQSGEDQLPPDGNPNDR